MTVCLINISFIDRLLSQGRGTVVDAALLTGKLKVQLDNAPEGAPVIVNREEVRVVRAPRRGGKNEKKADKPAQAEK